MRIVYVLTSLGIGGAERQVLALAARMADRGHDVAILVLRPRTEKEWPTTLRVVSLNMSKTPFSVWRSFMAGRRFLADFRPEIIHGHGFHANLVARLLKLVFSGPVVLSTIHNVYEGGWYRMLAYRLTDGLSHNTTAVSHAAADRFIRCGAVPAHKCVVVPNSFDPAEFEPQPGQSALVRAQLCGLNSPVSHPFVWLAAGRIATAKDYPNLLRAFAMVRATRPDARLWIAGEGGHELTQALRALSSELGLTDSLSWLGLRRDLPALLDAADAFVQSSAWEGMPLAIGEAMCMEKPVVATNVGGVSELLGEDGMLVPPRYPQMLAEAMLGLMEKSAWVRQALGRAARQRIERNFNWEGRIVAWQALYVNALQKGNSQ